MELEHLLSTLTDVDETKRTALCLLNETLLMYRNQNLYEWAADNHMDVKKMDVSEISDLTGKIVDAHNQGGDNEEAS